MTTVNISFPVDFDALRRRRHVRLVVGGTSRTPHYNIPLGNPLYASVHAFKAQWGQSGYRFRLIQLLHVTATKMLGWPNVGPRRKSLFAMGGLYLALDEQHADLCVRQTFGDFTSGFSHQFGVGLACMAAAEAYSLDWHSLNAIRVAGAKVLDYTAPIPGGFVEVEAKGTTSEGGRSQLALDAYRKKIVDPQDKHSVRSPRPQPTAMIAVIVEAAMATGSRGVIQIIDPAPSEMVDLSEPWVKQAGLYRHYAGVARFAGLLNTAEEFERRAKSLENSQRSFVRIAVVSVDEAAVFERGAIRYAGVQWRVGEANDAATDLWFYHGADVDRLNDILAKEFFRPCRPLDFDADVFDSREQLVDANIKEADGIEYLANVATPDTEGGAVRFIESILPDGSYFGIGTGPRSGLRVIDPRTPLRPLDTISR